MAAVTNNTLNREIGELKTRMSSTEDRLKSMEAKIDTVVEALAMSRGSIKTLVAIGTMLSIIAGAIGAAGAWIVGRH